MKSLFRNAILFALVAGSVHAQSVPAFINYQGRVTDSAGAGLGTGTPVNRKMIFRLFDAATGGNRVWSEEQTVTVSNGEFSVLLGNGINASYNSVTETPRNPLTTIFNGGDRYLELVVDNGDGTLNTSDTPIAPRQRLTSTAYAMRAATADSVVSGSDLNLGTADSGLGSYNSGRLWNGQNINGPVLYGTGGGALGSKNGAAVNTAIRWDGNGNVGIGTASPAEKLDVTGNAKISGSATFGSGISIGGGILPPTNSNGGAGMRLTLYEGGTFDPPFGFGIDGSTLFSVVPASATHKWYGGTNVKMSLSGNTGTLNVPGAGTFGSLAASGNLTAGNLTAGVATVSGNLNAGSAAVSGNLTAGTATVSGNFNAGTTTIGGVLTANQNIVLNGQKTLTLYDDNHGLAYYGNASAAKPSFAGANVNGPVLFGYAGGALGSTLTEKRIALQWDSDKNVAVGGNLTAGGKTVAVGEESLRIVRGVCQATNVGNNGIGHSSPNLTTGQPILYGRGYSFFRIDQARYRVTFATPFSAPPAFTCNPILTVGGEREFAKVTVLDADKVEVQFNNDDSNGGNDASFTFIAVGPR